MCDIVFFVCVRVCTGVKSSIAETTDDLSTRATLIISPLSVLSNWLVGKRTKTHILSQLETHVPAAHHPPEWTRVMLSLLFVTCVCAGPVRAARACWREAERVPVLWLWSQQEQEVSVVSGRGDHHLQRPLCWLWGECRQVTCRQVSRGAPTEKKRWETARSFTRMNFSLTGGGIIIFISFFQNKSPLHAISWFRVVLDEGHIIRNPNAQMSKAVLDLKAQRRWVLSGISAP